MDARRLAVERAAIEHDMGRPNTSPHGPSPAPREPPQTNARVLLRFRPKPEGAHPAPKDDHPIGLQPVCLASSWPYRTRRQPQAMAYRNGGSDRDCRGAGCRIAPKTVL